MSFFGRIDRIGSKNTNIQMINFFPNMELNEYLGLEARVKGKMTTLNLVSTGDEDVLTPEMNDFNFRKRQLERLKDEVIDIEDANDNISLTDLNMNEYLNELSEYIQNVPEIKKVPKGVYSVTDGDNAGVLFCFKHRNDANKPKSDSSLYPYYLIYMRNNGEVLFGNGQAKYELLDIMPEDVFDTPKPTKLIKYIINLVDNNKKAIVLDFFSGSGTTADSIMQLNAEDDGKRKYILVQLPENLDEGLEKASNDNKTVIKNAINLCESKDVPHELSEIAKERIRRAGDKIKAEHPDADIDIGFKVFRTADTNIKWNSLMDMGQIDMNQLEYTPDLVDFMPDANDVDVVYELMLRQRDVALSETLEQLSDIGSRTYLYASSYLVCLETQITEELVGKLAELDPLPIKFIFRDSAFKDDIALKDETFRRLKALIEKNAGTNKPTYTVEFI